MYFIFRFSLVFNKRKKYSIKNCNIFLKYVKYKSHADLLLGNHLGKDDISVKYKQECEINYEI